MNGMNCRISGYDLLALPNGKQVLERQNREDMQNEYIIALSNEESWNIREL